MSKAKTNPLKVIREAVAEWREKHSDTRLRDVVHGILDQRLSDTIGKLLGFQVSWGEWRLDHCNGRSGNSAAGDWLRKTAGAAVEEWLAKQAGNLPEIPRKAAAELRKEYLERYQYELRQRLGDLAAERAGQMANDEIDRLVGEVFPSDDDASSPEVTP